MIGSYLFLFFEIFLVALIVCSILHKYGNWKEQQTLVTCITFLAWYFCLLIIFLLPNDVTNTFYEDCLLVQKARRSISTTSIYISSTVSPNSTQTTSLVYNSSTVAPLPEFSCEKPWNYVAKVFFLHFWRVIYWSCQFMTWIFLPMVQSYAKAGEFTIRGKLKSALIDNALYYGTYLLIFGICFVYVATRPDINIDFAGLKVIGITASNTWGLILIVFFLGFGLVEVPRTLWGAGCPGVSLQKSYFRLAKLTSEVVDADEEIEDLMHEIFNLSERVSRLDSIRPNMDVILNLCGDRIHVAETHRRPRYLDKEDEVTQKMLVKVHSKLKKALVVQNRSRVQLNEAYDSAIFLEDIDHNRGSRVREFRSGSGSPICPTYLWGYINLDKSPMLEYFWKCHVRFHLLKILSLTLAALSLIVWWSECTFFIKSPVLSIFAVLVKRAAATYNDWAIQSVSFFTLGYLSVCTYFTVFRLKIFNYFRLVSNHQTDANSLIFSGMLFCRLTPPLCLNFLGLIHMDSHVAAGEDRMHTETAYTQLMGHLDLIAIISDGVNLYFPLAVVLFSIATYFRLGSRVLQCIGVQQFLSSDDNLTLDLVEEGKILLKRERSHRERDMRKAAKDDEDEDEVFNQRLLNETPRNGHTYIRAATSSPSKRGVTEGSGLLPDSQPVEFDESSSYGLYDPFRGSSTASGSQGPKGGQRDRPARPTYTYKSAKDNKGFFDDI